MHQDLRVVVRIIQSRADARSPGEQRAAERNKQSRSDHCAELGLLPPRPGRRGHVARALHHAGRGRGPVIGAALGRGPHGSTLGRRFAQVHASCKNGTRGWLMVGSRPARDGSGADGSRPGPVGRVFCYFQQFGSGVIFVSAWAQKACCCIVISGRNTRFGLPDERPRAAAQKALWLGLPDEHTRGCRVS